MRGGHQASPASAVVSCTDTSAGLSPHLASSPDVPTYSNSDTCHGSTHTIVSSDASGSHSQDDFGRSSRGSVSSPTKHNFGDTPSLCGISRGLTPPLSSMSSQIPLNAANVLTHNNSFRACNLISIAPIACSAQGLDGEVVSTSSTRAAPVLHEQGTRHKYSSRAEMSSTFSLIDASLDLNKQQTVVPIPVVPLPEAAAEEQPAPVLQPTSRINAIILWCLTLVISVIHIGIFILKAHAGDAVRWAMFGVESFIMVGLAVGLVLWSRW